MNEKPEQFSKRNKRFLFGRLSTVFLRSIGNPFGQPDRENLTNFASQQATSTSFINNKHCGWYLRWFPTNTHTYNTKPRRYCYLDELLRFSELTGQLLASETDHLIPFVDLKHQVGQRKKRCIPIFTAVKDIPSWYNAYTNSEFSRKGCVAAYFGWNPRFGPRCAIKIGVGPIQNSALLKVYEHEWRPIGSVDVPG